MDEISRLIYFFKQKTADELRISDWSSDVCSSDLARAGFSREYHRADPPLAQGARTQVRPRRRRHHARQYEPRPAVVGAPGARQRRLSRAGEEIGRASCRERVCQYV